jgi:hypothetical protein
VVSFTVAIAISGSYDSVTYFIFLAVLFAVDSHKSNASPQKRKIAVTGADAHESILFSDNETSRYLSLVLSNLSHDLLSPTQALQMGLVLLKETLEARGDAREDEAALTQYLLSALMFYPSLTYRMIDMSMYVRDHKLHPTCIEMELWEHLNVFRNVGFGGYRKFEMHVHNDSIKNRFLMYTDVRWFNGNVQCMASNAMKFSTGPAHVPVEMHVRIFTSSLGSVSSRCTAV